jgi:hypothetical protein
MKLLIGNTGLIGTTLKDSLSFDYEFNSANINDLILLETNDNTDIYLSCLSAEKWKVNKDPQSDLDNILKIIEILSIKKFRNIILYSTIDVYEGAPNFSNEDNIPKIPNLNYGSNRYLFELLVKSNLSYSKLLIIRLPALFGKHIKKNILFDLLNNNQIENIKIKSQYQWYNLNNLVIDSNSLLENSTFENKYLCINLFSEPVETYKIVEFFNKNELVDNNNTGVFYNYSTKYSQTGYITSSQDILNDIRNFILDYEILKRKLKIAICLFGEPRSILAQIPYWQSVQKKLHSVDFYAGLYLDPNLQDIIGTLKNSLNLKDYHIAYNDLDKFNSTKYKAKNPIYIYAIDHKATIPRLMSQHYIRQKSIELVNNDDYDAIIMCRSDKNNLNLSINDIIDVVNDDSLLIVSEELDHKHPGGGGGCCKCTIDLKCDNDYHSNDICDWWCIGSPKAMNPWKTFYDTTIDNYGKIQEKSVNLNSEHLRGKIAVNNNLNENEIHVTFNIHNLILIENDVHCFYPEKIMRVAFKDMKIIGSNRKNENRIK